jgi:methylmalonyl-CoA mutase N-terminal domain/subunit
MESGKRIIVGLNKFHDKENEEPELLKIDMKVQEEQIKFLNKVRIERDQQKVDNYLNNLKRAANTGENLIPYIIDAVKSYASIGEICNAMRTIFGEYKEKVII